MVGILHKLTSTPMAAFNSFQEASSVTKSCIFAGLVGAVGLAAIIYPKILKPTKKLSDVEKIFSESTVEKLSDEERIFRNSTNRELFRQILSEFTPPRLFLEPKRKYYVIACPKDTCVKVGNEYLHANYVGEEPNKMIAAQLPYPTSVIRSLFWQVVMREGSVIVDLCTKATPPSDRYYPVNKDKPVKYERMEVGMLKKKDHNCKFSDTNNCTLYKYRVKDTETNEERKIYRIHYNAWEEGGVINPAELNKLILLIRKIKQRSPDKLPIIHCDAGMGRTGTLCASIYLRAKLEDKTIDKSNYPKKFIDIIRKLKSQRGPIFIENVSQVGLVRKYFLQLLDHGTANENILGKMA